MYAAADAMLGRLVKVTPSSKVVGDLALHLVGADVTPAEFDADPGRYDIPDSVVSFLRGELGDPPGGWPEPFRRKPLAGRAPVAVAQGDKVEAGQTVATIEAMKMEAAITAPRAAVIRRLAISRVQQVEGGDLLVELD